MSRRAPNAAGDQAVRPRKSRYSLGIDVGGTKIAGAVVDLSNGQVLLRRQVPTEHHRSGSEILETTYTLAAELRDQAQGQGIVLAGMGVGVAELVDPLGNVFSAHRIAWQDVPVRERLSNVLPTRLESDVRTAAIGEAHYGQGRGMSDFIYVTVGTGISAVLVQNGVPYLGSRGAALVIANGITSCRCPHCRRESSYTLEDFASGPALVARFNSASATSLVRAEDVLRASELGDGLASEVIDSAASALGGALGLLVNALDPVAVIVGGGLGSGSAAYFEKLSMAVRRHLWRAGDYDLKIARSGLGVDAGIVGAAFVAPQSNQSDNMAIFVADKGSATLEGEPQ